MAFVPTAVAGPTGKMANVEMFGPNLVFKRGTWVATGVTKGHVDLTAYMSEILIGNFHAQTGTGITLSDINTNDTPAVAAGYMAILACTANDAGSYQAIGVTV
jgi:hypothetical protein